MADLVAMVRDGKIRVPAYQRPLRWKTLDVLKLFDSIWHGFPIGSLIFWQHEAMAGKEIVGGAEILVPSRPDAWWVVDGQQRITALAAALLDLDHHVDRRWVVSFDPDALEFVSGSRYLPEHFVPVSTLVDLRRLFLWIQVQEHRVGSEYIDRLEDARRQLLDYTIPAYVIDTNDAEVIRAIFVRINSSGATMRAGEVLQALMAHPAQERSGLDLDGLQLACDRDDFGMPSRAEVLQSFLAMSGVEPPGRLDDPADLLRDPVVAYEDAREALTRLVSFLQEECKIPHVRLLPFMGIFLVLARWFHVHRSGEPATIKRLAHWVWRVSAIATHQHPASSWVREQLRAIQEGDEQASLDRLGGLVGARPPLGWKLTRFNPRTVRSRIEILAMLWAEPRDASGPIRLRELLSRDRIAGEIVGRRDRQDLRHHDLGGSAANRALLSSMHSALQRELRAWDFKIHEAALRSHLIGPEAFAALQTMNYDEFLRLRALALEEHIAEFLEDHACWGDPVVRPHRYYSDDILDGEALR